MLVPPRVGNNLDGGRSMKRLLGCAVAAFVVVAQQASADVIFFDDFHPWRTATPLEMAGS